MFVKRRRHDGKGQSLIEFLFVVPIAFLLLLGPIDLGKLLSTHNEVAIAARQAARMLSESGQDGDITTNIDNSVEATLKDSGLSLQGLRSVTLFCPATGGPVQYGCGTLHQCISTYDPSTKTWQVVVDPNCNMPWLTGTDVGVSITYHYAGLTPLLAGGVDFTESTQTEMLPSGDTGTHQPLASPPICDATSCTPT